MRQLPQIAQFSIPDQPHFSCNIYIIHIESRYTEVE